MYMVCYRCILYIYIHIWIYIYIHAFFSRPPPYFAPKEAPSFDAASRFGTPVQVSEFDPVLASSAQESPGSSRPRCRRTARRSAWRT